MDVIKARDIVLKFYDEQHHSREDEFVLVEALEYLAFSSGEPEQEKQALFELGAFYYEHRKFDLALKYYQLAEQAGSTRASVNLGYIWYYGRTGTVDYEKARECFVRGKCHWEAALKLADMYRYGQGVPQDIEEYRELIELAYEAAVHFKRLNQPYPEIVMRLAQIRTEQGRLDEAADLYCDAKDFLAQRLQHDRFFGNFARMKNLVRELHQLVQPEPEWMDFYDLYELLRQPVKVQFRCGETLCQVETVQEVDGPAVCFQNRWFRTADDFIEKAELNGRYLTELTDQMDEFEVEQ